MREKIAYYLLRSGVVILVLTPFVLGGGFYLANSTDKLIFWCVALILLIVGAALLSREERNQILKTSAHPLSIVLFVFIAWLTCRSFFSWNHLSWWGSWTRTDGLWMWWGMWVAWPILRFWSQKEEKIWRWALFGFVAVAILTTLLQLILAATILPNFFPSGRPVGFVGNAVYLALILLFVPWAATETPVAKKWWWSILILLIIVGLFNEIGTRSVVLGMAAAGVWLLIDLGRKWRQWQGKQIVGAVVIATLLLGGLLVANSFFASRLLRWFDGSTNTRLALWRIAGQEIKRRPIIGYGVGEQTKILDGQVAEIVAQNYAESNFDTTHSAYIDLMLQGGVVALLLILLVIVSAIYFLPTPWQRATVVFYAVAVSTAFLNPWSNIPFLLLLVGARKIVVKPKIQKYFGGVLAVVGGVVFLTALFTLLAVPFAAYQLKKVVDLGSTGGSIQQFVARLEKLNGPMPFVVERDMEILRASTLLQQRAVSFLAWEDLVAQTEPRFAALVQRPDLAAREYWSLGIFATNFIQTTTEKSMWQERAEKILRAGREEFLGFPPLTYDLAALLVNRDRTNEAISLLQNYAQKYPLIPDNFYWLARFQFLAGQKKEARVNISHAFVDFPGWVWSEENRAWYTKILEAAK